MPSDKPFTIMPPYNAPLFSAHLALLSSLKTRNFPTMKFTIELKKEQHGVIATPTATGAGAQREACQ